MPPTQDTTPYEVRCHHCNVSFPVGTKRCVHCGEKIGRSLFAPMAEEDGMPVFQSQEIEEAEAEPRGGRWLRVGFTLFWLAIAFGSAAIRACRGDSP